jgi:GDP-D-mannose dehydratase
LTSSAFQSHIFTGGPTEHLLFHRWQGEGTQEVGINKATGDVHVRIDERYFRPAEVE